jgi:hypothetical protein
MARKFRDYSNKRWANPMFERKSGLKRRLPWGRWLGGLAVLALVGGGIWLLLFSDFLRVTDLEVSGNDHVQTWEIQDAVKGLMRERRWFVVPKSNILVLPESEFITRLTDQFVFASVEITKRPPHRLDIVVRERASTVTLKFPDGEQVVLGLGGTVVPLYRPTDPEPDPKLLEHEAFGDQQESFSLKQKVLDPTVVEAVINAPDAFKTAFTDGVGLKEIHFDSVNSSTMRLVTTEGWMIYTDAQTPLAPQLQNAVTVLKEKVGADRPKLDYIDVRFGEKVFFKLKSV